MVRKLTALFLFSLMMVATATSQAGLRYCLCLETLFVGECECSELVSAGDCPRTFTKAGDSCECSGCEISEEPTAETSLRNDCLIDLTFQMGDFSGAAGGDGIGKSASVDLGVIFSSYSTEFSAPARCSSSNGTRGPPPCRVVSPVPLFIRHSVFLV